MEPINNDSAKTAYTTSYCPRDIADRDDWHTSDDNNAVGKLPKVASWRLVLALATLILLVAVGTTVTALHHVKPNVSTDEPATAVANAGSSSSQSEPILNTTEATITPAMPLRAVEVTQYINRIKLSDGILVVPETSLTNSTTSEEAALAWLIYDDPLQLSPDSDANQFRLRQRYARLTLLLQYQDFVQWTKWFTASDSECYWNYVASCTNATEKQPPQVTGIYVNHLKPVKEASLPLDVGLLTKLVSFEAVYTTLTKTIPESLGTAWTDLKLFAAYNNALTGSIPLSLGATWTNLETFDIGVNNLTGSIPSTLGATWTNLEVFQMDGNALTGSLPSTFGATWTNLEAFSVARNHLAGSLPSTFGATWTGLEDFSVQDNGLTGSIPSSLNNWNVIYRAYFQFNSFVGFMPNELCNSEQLRHLEADCSRPEIKCPCCTECCSDVTQLCGTNLNWYW